MCSFVASGLRARVAPCFSSKTGFSIEDWVFDSGVNRAPLSIEPRTRGTMSKPKAAPPVETILPARNFTISLADRVRALDGAPAYITRKRTIEDLEEWLVERIASVLAS